MNERFKKSLLSGTALSLLIAIAPMTLTLSADAATTTRRTTTTRKVVAKPVAKPAVKTAVRTTTTTQSTAPMWEDTSTSTYQSQQNYGQPGVYGNPAYGNGSYSNNPQLRGYVSTAPTGTTLNTTLTTTVSSEFAQVGDPVTATLSDGLNVNNQQLLPAGSLVQGTVASVQSAKRFSGNGRLEVRFNRAQLPNGMTIPLSAKLVTEDGTGIIKGGVGWESRGGNAVKNTAVGGAAGAGLGALTGVLFGRNAGTYALRGAALGGAAGLGKAALDRGNEAQLPAGRPVRIMLDQPLTVSADASAGVYNNTYPTNTYPNNSYPTTAPYGSTAPYGTTSPAPYGGYNTAPTTTPNPYGY